MARRELHRLAVEEHRPRRALIVRPLVAQHVDAQAEHLLVHLGAGVVADGGEEAEVDHEEKAAEAEDLRAVVLDPPDQSHACVLGLFHQNPNTVNARHAVSSMSGVSCTSLHIKTLW